MMTVLQRDENEAANMAYVYEDIVTMLDDRKLSPDAAMSVLAKMLAQLAVSMDSRDEFAQKMLFAYDMERFLRPTSQEVH
jgi:hypothetical protein